MRWCMWLKRLYGRCQGLSHGVWNMEDLQLLPKYSSCLQYSLSTKEEWYVASNLVAWQFLPIQKIQNYGERSLGYAKWKRQVVVPFQILVLSILDSFILELTFGGGWWIFHFLNCCRRSFQLPNSGNEKSNFCPQSFLSFPQFVNDIFFPSSDVVAGKTSLSSLHVYVRWKIYDIFVRLRPLYNNSPRISNHPMKTDRCNRNQFISRTLLVQNVSARKKSHNFASLRDT